MSVTTTARSAYESVGGAVRTVDDSLETLANALLSSDVLGYAAWLALGFGTWMLAAAVYATNPLVVAIGVVCGFVLLSLGVAVIWGEYDVDQPATADELADEQGAPEPVSRDQDL